MFRTSFPRLPRDEPGIASIHPTTICKVTSGNSDLVQRNWKSSRNFPEGPKTQWKGSPGFHFQGWSAPFLMRGTWGRLSWSPRGSPHSRVLARPALEGSRAKGACHVRERDRPPCDTLATAIARLLPSLFQVCHTHSLSNCRLQ